MQALIQRVSQASVCIDGQTTASIGQGLLVLVCAEPDDTPEIEKKLLQKIVKLRIFSDVDGKMNCSVSDVGGALLIVSQFTLAADTSRGNRPSFTQAANPHDAKLRYDSFVALARQTGLEIATGEFAANMQIHLVNDGPVTIPMSVR